MDWTNEKALELDSNFLEAYSLLKICKIVLKHTLKCSQLISSSDNKKILLTTRKSCWQPEISGWIKDGRYAMQQNTK